ncbi:hypothetical protein PUNSTDRAFT_141174 [Punctularia strigosozonata HHB-11173 SS5]|uniref:uncharacterized protein n=1 Tax=Punctularia strigosozonata (strain HHB-11173) TaxID=741275 RepID=UPI0004417FF7|nr:uncharacterized protein PUNSTDRAFT_141174 [Punctularia strigosozonata HHB-11173 SS5]EIN12483.1 hypothetical protein PUNSTDRAFT_141174 [Punctularia strigosozonata HHB-11173 SS5]
MEDVQIIAAGSFDTSGNEKHSILVIGWVLDAPLDPLILEHAWAKLNSDWPILSARLRNNGKEWEFHVPKSANRYGFRHLAVNAPIASRYDYPKISADSIQCTIKHFPYDLYSDPACRSMNDLFTKDIPNAALQLTNFEDASIVGLTIPHVLADGHGVKVVLNALLQTLHGEEVAPIDPIPEPFAKFKDVPQPPAVVGWRLFNFFQMLTFVACMLWDRIRYPKYEVRELYVPQKEVERIKQQAMDDIRNELGEQTGEWVSTSDALVAFTLKGMYPSETSQRSFSLMYSANIRSQVPSLVPPVYLGNAAYGVVLSRPVKEISSMSLGALALLVRRILQEQTSQAATEDYLRWRLSPINFRKMTMFMEPSGLWNVITNWRNMKLMDVDFTPALPSGSEVKSVNCVYLGSGSHMTFPTRHCFGLTADDPRGGVWMSGDLAKEMWERKDGFGRFAPSNSQ